MNTQMVEIIKLLKEGDAHFVLAVGSNDDWIAMIQRDDHPDEAYCWGVADDPTVAIDKMLTSAPPGGILD